MSDVDDSCVRSLFWGSEPRVRFRWQRLCGVKYIDERSITVMGRDDAVHNRFIGFDSSQIDNEDIA